MDLRHLRQLIAIIRHGSLAKAADALGLAQPSLSKSVARLEDELKVKLFDRSARGAQLTPIGALVVERAHKIIAETDSLSREVELVAGGDSGRVRLGVGNTLRSVFLPRFSVMVAERFPRLQIEFTVSDRSRLLPDLREGRLDMAFFALGDELEDPQLVCVPVLQDEAVAVASPEHPLAGQRRIPIETFDFRLEGAVTNIGGGESAAALVGEPLSRAFYVTNDFEALLPLVERGRATMLAPGHMLRPHIVSGRVVRLDVDWSFRMSYVAMTTRAASYSPVLTLIVRQAQAIGRELEEGVQASGGASGAEA